MNRKIPWLALAVAVLLAAALIARSRHSPAGPNVRPEASAELESPNPHLLAEFTELIPEQIAVLLLGASQEAFPAVRTLEPVGVPFFITRDLAAALKHRIVFIPADDRPLRLTNREKSRLRHFLSGGGVLVLQAPAVDVWPEFTGLREARPARSRKSLVFDVASDPAFAYLRESEQARIPLASPQTAEAVWSTALIPEASSQTAVIASFPETGEAAMVRHRVGNGFVYTIGIDLRDAVVRPQAGRAFDAQRVPFNGYEPAADVFPLIFRSWYEHYTPTWVRLRAAPGEAKAMFLVSHDIGVGTTIRAAEEFSRIEKQHGIKATYFVQTKYVLDAQTTPFLDNRLVVFLKRLSQDGHEIASHGVAAAPELESAPLGTGAETMKDYRPKLDRGGQASGITLMGELHVSKTLLEARLAGEKIAGYRSRLFSYPEALDIGLSRAGYAYDSSLRAAFTLSHFPFKLMERRTMIRESDIIELPMAFEDAGKDEGIASIGPILATLRRVAAYEGTFVWLLSPTGEPAKKVLLRSVLDARPPGLQTMSLGDAARFWQARSKTRFWFEPSADLKNGTLHLRLPGQNADKMSFETSARIISCSPAEETDRDFEVRCSSRIITLERTGGAKQAAVEIKFK